MMIDDDNDRLLSAKDVADLIRDNLNAGNLIEAGWVKDVMAACPEATPQELIESMRGAYFSGAACVMGILAAAAAVANEKRNSPVVRATGAKMFHNIQVELIAFTKAARERDG